MLPRPGSDSSSDSEFRSGGPGTADSGFRPGPGRTGPGQGQTRPGTITILGPGHPSLSSHDGRPGAPEPDGPGNHESSWRFPSAIRPSQAAAQQPEDTILTNYDHDPSQIFSKLQNFVNLKDHRQDFCTRRGENLRNLNCETLQNLDLAAKQGFAKSSETIFAKSCKTQELNA